MWLPILGNSQFHSLHDSANIYKENYPCNSAALVPFSNDQLNARSSIHRTNSHRLYHW